MSDNPILTVMRARQAAAALVDMYAGIIIDCDEQAEEAIYAIRQCIATTGAAKAAAKELASERRRLVDANETIAKETAKELAALEAATRSLLADYVRKRSNDSKLASEARRAMVDAERARLVESGDTIAAEMLADPAPIETPIPGLSVGSRRELAISDADALCRAILSGELPHDVLSLNQAAVRNLISAGHSTPGISIHETQTLIIRSEP